MNPSEFRVNHFKLLKQMRRVRAFFIIEYMTMMLHFIQFIDFMINRIGEELIKPCVIVHRLTSILRTCLSEPMN